MWPGAAGAAGRWSRSAGRCRLRPPVLTPGEIGKICDACAWFDPATGGWQGRVRDRLLWALLAESGLRLGEALGLQHRDWHTGRGDSPFVEVVPRDHPHGVRVKGGRCRRVFISDALDRLYGEHLWQLCEAGADTMVADLDAAPVFVNLAGGTRFAPWRPDSVYDLVDRLRRQLAGRFRRRGRRIGCGIRMPPRFCCRGFRCTWCPVGSATPTCVGHADVQTTLQLYAHVTEDADLQAAAQWQAFTVGWRAGAAGAALTGGCV